MNRDKITKTVKLGTKVKHSSGRIGYVVLIDQDGCVHVEFSATSTEYTRETSYKSIEALLKVLEVLS